MIDHDDLELNSYMLFWTVWPRSDHEFLLLTVCSLFLHLVWSLTSGVRALHLLCQTQFECGVFWCSILCGGDQQWNGSLLQPSAVKSCSCAAVGAFWAHCPVLLCLALPYSPLLCCNPLHSHVLLEYNVPFQMSSEFPEKVCCPKQPSSTSFPTWYPWVAGPLTVFCSAFRLKYCLCLVLFFLKKDATIFF